VVSHSKCLVTIQFLGCQWCQPIADSTIPADRKKPGGPATRRALRRGDSWRYRRPSPGAYRAQLQMGSGRLEPHGQGISRAICVGKHWGQGRNGSFPNQLGPSKKKLTCALQLWLAASCNFLGSRSHRDTKTNEFYSGQSVTECLNSPVTTCRSMQPKIMHRGRFSKIRPNFLFLGSIYLNQ
jgi:hypothetical protein